ncbi:MAG: imidazoleglycerol-phosphate dehydratase [Candidatus Acetothermia bacterium]
MKRRTEEVVVEISLSEEGQSVETGDDVLDHLLETLLFYMEIPGTVRANGDLPHHLWEDTGILFGRALREEVETSKTARFGSALIPMDEALVLCAVDISRPFLNFDMESPVEEEGFSAVLPRQFLSGLTRSLEATLHLKRLEGRNSHHVVEAGFKALGISLAKALEIADGTRSTKGWLR